jgi:transposase
MEESYSSRGIAKACRQNMNFMYLLNGNNAPSQGILNGFRNQVLGKLIEKLFYELVKYLERCGEVRNENAFIDGTQATGTRLYSGRTWTGTKGCSGKR